MYGNVNATPQNDIALAAVAANGCLVVNTAAL